MWKEDHTHIIVPHVRKEAKSESLSDVKKRTLHSTTFEVGSMFEKSENPMFLDQIYRVPLRGLRLHASTVK